MVVLKLFDKDITTVNKWLNPDTKRNEYKIHHLKGFWDSNDGISISNTQLIKNDGLIALILMSESGYVKAKDYKGEENTWTLQNDDYLVKGKLERAPLSINDVLENYECMKIVDFSIKDYGSEDMWHFEIKGE